MFRKVDAGGLWRACLMTWGATGQLSYSVSVEDPLRNAAGLRFEEDYELRAG